MGDSIKKFEEMQEDKENKFEVGKWAEIIEDEKPQPTNTQPHYKGSQSLYKVAEDFGLNSYEFDIIKRIVRCRHKGEFIKDLNKTIDLINIYKKEHHEE
jgi:hypothetical protein